MRIRTRRREVHLSGRMEMTPRTLHADPGPQCLEEQAAYDRAMAFARVQDRAGFIRAWAEFARLHSERPQAVVQALEARKGLA